MALITPVEMPFVLPVRLLREENTHDGFQYATRNSKTLTLYLLVPEFPASVAKEACYLLKICQEFVGELH